MQSGTQASFSTRVSDFVLGSVFNQVVRGLTVLPRVANKVMAISVELIEDDVENETIGSKLYGALIQPYTIYNTVMGNYKLLNISYHRMPDLSQGKPTDGSAEELLKYYVGYYYNVLRNLVVALSLFILIYIGIRMAVSTVASEKAKYKKMILHWATSLILLYFMHYLITIISWASESILNLIKDFSTNLVISSKGVTAANFEEVIYTNAYSTYESAGFFDMFGSALTIWILTFYQMKFFIMYMRRVIEIGFLIMISPLVTVTYAIDKIGDGKAQAYRAWLDDLIMKMIIQVVHAILYMVFIVSAGYIAQTNPILSALFFALLGRSEKIVRRTLNVKDASFEKIKVPFMEHRGPKH